MPPHPVHCLRSSVWYFGKAPSQASMFIQRPARAVPSSKLSHHRRKAQKLAPHPSQTPQEVQEATAAFYAPCHNPGAEPKQRSTFHGKRDPLNFTIAQPLAIVASSMVGLGVVFLFGVLYNDWYKKHTLAEIEEILKPGSSPALELAALTETYHHWTHGLLRKEQNMINKIFRGEESGQYFMMLGPKGVGKTAMIINAMSLCRGDGIAMCTAHPDLEVFRQRLGRAINFKFNEDNQAELFHRKEPRAGGPVLDIEQAMDKLERVAIKHTREQGKPFILIIDGIHVFQNSEEGRNMLSWLQQRAEVWAASEILTMVFMSDDFWPYSIMRKNAPRMHVLQISDLSHKEAILLATRIRQSDVNFSGDSAEEGQKVLREAISIVGGRSSYVSEVSKSEHMLAMAEHLKEIEKAWILSQIGLIPDCDNNAVDEQKWSACAWLLLREFVREREKQIAELKEKGVPDGDLELPLPSISLYRCRQIMTRADYLEELDRLNIISIDIQHNVQPESNLVLAVAQQVVQEKSFDALLNSVLGRIAEVDALKRTRRLHFSSLSKKHSA